MNRIISIVILSLFVNVSLAQNSPESLRIRLDSILELPLSIDKVDALNAFSESAIYIDQTITEEAIKEAYSISISNHLHTQAGLALKLSGILADISGEYSESIQLYQKAIIEYKLAKDTLSIAKCEGNIGVIYIKTKKQREAIPYFESSYEIFDRYDFTIGKMIGLQHLGMCQIDVGTADSALYYLLQAERLMMELGFMDPNVFTNLGLIYFQMGDYDTAEKKLLQALEIYQNSDPNSQGIANLYQSIASNYGMKGDDISSLLYMKKAEEAYNGIHYTREYAYFLSNAATLHGELEDYKKAYEYLLLKNKVKDSIYTVDNLLVISDMKGKYESEKKELEIQTLNDKNKLESLKTKREEEKVTYFTIGAVLVGILLIWIIYSLIQKSSDNKKIKTKNLEIEFQRLELEDKNKELISSITYAKRIQTAILPDKDKIDKLIPESFVLYKPKDIVAGDFYWIEEKQGVVYFAAADCTGHGVPGAMMSVICSTALQKSLKEFQLNEPGQLLDKTRELVINQLSSTSETVKDGMDIALCSLKGNQLSYAGANNPLWIFRENELIEIKANKQPIGLFDKNTAFDTHLVELKKNDMIYIFSDGYVDQFGGEKGKKLKSKALKQILMSITNSKPALQKKELDEQFETWKGDLEQVDDVVIIGLKFTG